MTNNILLLPMLLGLVIGCGSGDKTEPIKAQVNELPSSPTKDSFPFWYSLFDQESAQLGSKTYFVADDGLTGEELWVTDGTATGTHLVKDILPGRGGSQPRAITVAKPNGNDALLFFAWIPDSRFANSVLTLWKTDGTENGTVRIGGDWAIDGSQFRTYSELAHYYGDLEIVPMANGIYILAGETLRYNRILWYLEFSNLNKQDIPPSIIRTNILSWEKLGEKLVYTAFTSLPKSLDKCPLYSVSGVIEKFIVDQFNCVGSGAPYYLRFEEYNGSVYLWHDNGLWRTDGVGIEQVKNVQTGSAFQNPFLLGVVNNKLIFESNNANDLAIWAIDGQEIYKEATLDAAESEVRFLNMTANYIYFFQSKSSSPGTKRTLYRANGSKTGGLTLLQSDFYWPLDNQYDSFNSYGYSKPIQTFTEIGSQVFYVSGHQLYRSNGDSDAATKILPTNEGGPIDRIATGYQIALGDEFVYLAHDSIYGDTIWAVNSEGNQKMLVKQRNKIINFEHAGFYAGKQEVYFYAWDEIQGRELWKYDGKVASLVKDINQTPVDAQVKN